MWRRTSVVALLLVAAPASQGARPRSGSCCCRFQAAPGRRRELDRRVVVSSIVAVALFPARCTIVAILDSVVTNRISLPNKHTRTQALLSLLGSVKYGRLLRYSDGFKSSSSFRN